MFSERTTSQSNSTFRVVGFTDIGGNIREIINVNGGRTSQCDEFSGNLSVTAVPEPASWALLAVGLFVTMILRRRKVSLYALKNLCR